MIQNLKYKLHINIRNTVVQIGTKIRKQIQINNTNTVVKKKV